MDGNGKRRTNLDQDAQYTITYAGGSTTVTVDQNQTNVMGNDVWVNLGVYSFNGPATVTLTRGDTDPNDWTIADTVKLTAAGHSDVVVGSPTLSSFSTQQRPDHAGAGRLRGAGEQLRGLRPAVSHCRQPRFPWPGSTRDI